MDLTFQVSDARIPLEEIKRRLSALQPEVTWCHRFDFGGGVSTLLPDQEPYFTKAKGLKIIGREILEAIPYITRKGSVTDLSVLDLACAEGCHSIEFGAAGARSVLGVEGRQLYVDRATLAADAYGLSNVKIQRGDVREVSSATIGRHDLVLFFGILHHLAAEVFLDILRRLHDVTADTMVLYTHTSEAGCEAKFGNRLSPEFEIEGGYRGRNYMEHPEHATLEQRARRVRNSLDNTYSFWARENSLIKALRDVGFANISRMMHPNPFGNPAGEFRVLYVCRRAI